MGPIVGLVWTTHRAQLVFGTLHGTLDVGMNAHAVTVEQTLRRPILNGCHAAWSIGAVTGSLLGSAAVQLGLSRSQHYLVPAVLLIPAAWLTGRLLRPSAVHTLPVAQRPLWWQGGTPRLVLFGAMGATVLTAEAAVANWSGIFPHDRTGATLGAAALGYVAFTAAQTGVRLVGSYASVYWSALLGLRSSCSARPLRSASSGSPWSGSGWPPRCRCCSASSATWPRATTARPRWWRASRR